MIGSIEHIEEPTGAAGARLTGLITAAVIATEAIRRRRAHQLEQAAAAARVRTAAPTTTAAAMMPAPDRDTVLQQWRDAVGAGTSGAGSAREAERILSHIEPDLMTRYTDLARDGSRPPAAAMAQAVSEVPANTTPPAQVPTTASWSAHVAVPDQPHQQSDRSNRSLLAVMKRGGGRAA